MSDHYHGEYAEARHDHRGDYADSSHDHDIEYARKHHVHYDLAGDAERAHSRITHLQEELGELRDNLRDALERIRALEDRANEEDQGDKPEDESWRSTLADYQVASGSAEYAGEDQDDEDSAPDPARALAQAISDGSTPPRLPRLGERCPDCGRASCTGGDCYWPDEAGIARPEAGQP